MNKSFKQSLLTSVLSVSVLSVMGFAHAAPEANALPVGENVVKGTASFNRNIPNRLIVNQTGDTLITDWNSFDVGSAARVSFKQPSAASVAVNRVTTGRSTEIFGAINANGQLFIVNPNGITFGAGSQVRAASIVASVIGVSDEYFSSSHIGLGEGANRLGYDDIIENYGTLTATNGSVVLLASDIKNAGRITATGGDAILANARTVDLSYSEGPLISGSPRSGMIQNSGILQASRFESKGGKILLKADTWQYYNNVTLSGRVLSTDGLKVIANKVNIGNLSSNNNSQFIAPQINFNGIFNLEGKYSHLSLDSESNDPVDYSLSSSAKINFKESHSILTVDGKYFKLIRTMDELYDFSRQNSFHWQYALAADIDANTISTVPWNRDFKPIGDSDHPFNGTFDGLGHNIRGLRIQQPYGYAAFFGYTGGYASIRNLNLINVNMNGFAAAGLVYRNLGGDLSNNQVTGNIRAEVIDYNPYISIHDYISLAAGLVGINEYGDVSNNRVNVKVSSVGHVDRTWIKQARALEQAGLAGGLIAINDASVNQNTVTGTVTGQYKVGGLIGENKINASVYGNTSSANVVASKPLNAASPRGFIGVLFGNDTGSVFDNASTGTLTFKWLNH